MEAGVRGETSLDAWEARKLATANGPDAERYKNEYLEATFSDTISIYLLSLYLDVDYYDLRERDYPLLAPSALAERSAQGGRIVPAQYRIRVRNPLQAPWVIRWPQDIVLIPHAHPVRRTGTAFRCASSFVTFVGTLLSFSVSLAARYPWHRDRRRTARRTS